MNSWWWITGFGICNCERWFPQTCSCVSSQDGLSLQLETGGYVAVWSELILLLKRARELSLFACSTWSWALYVWPGRKGCRGAECPLSRYQGVDLWRILERLKLVQTWAGFWCFGCFSTSMCKVRGRDCGDKPADWLTKFMGEPLRLDALTWWGSDCTLYLRLFKHDLTDDTRRLARPKYKKLYPVLVSKSNFYHYHMLAKIKLSAFRQTTVFQCLLMSLRTWWTHKTSQANYVHDFRKCPQCQCPGCPKCQCLLESLFPRWPQDQVWGT